MIQKRRELNAVTGQTVIKTTTPTPAILSL